MNKTIFYQSSLPRAGSTLLQNILGQNPDIYVTPTSGVLELLYSSRVQYSTSPEFKAQDPELMKKAYLNFCRYGLQGYYEAITDKPYIIDKSRGWGIHYNFLNEINPDPKIICMVRDLRCIFSSMEKKFRENPDKDFGIIKWAQLEGTTTEKRVNMWANNIPIGIATERLVQMILEGIDKKILFVKYEDLISTPRIELLRIYEYLNIEPFNHYFDDIEQITKEDDEVYGIFGDHKIRPKLIIKEPDYNEILGVDLSNNIFTSYQWFYDYFKYKQ